MGAQRIFLMMGAVALGGVAVAEMVKVPAVALTSASSVTDAGDAMRGREKFVSLGCVQCHSVGGVGGKVAPAFDAPKDGSDVDPVDFASWMWESADLMLPLQEMENGYEIVLNGEDIRDLAAFMSSPEAQAGFSMEDIPQSVRETILGEIDLSDTDSEERYDGQEWHGPSPFERKED